MDFSDFWTGPLTDEEKAERDQAEMRTEDLIVRLQRLVSEELSVDQLDVLGAVFTHISSSPEPRATATFYEGQITASKYVREIRLGEFPAADLTTDADDE